MKYITADGKCYNISNTELENNMRILGISKDEAVQMWLEDNEIEINEEQAALDKEAKAAAVGADTGLTKKRKAAPRTVKVSNEKKTLFESILANIDRCEGVDRTNVAVLKENKLLQVKIGEKIFKIDIIEQRPKK